MKRVLCLLLALFLPVVALADTIAERVNAPEHWQGEFQSNTGRTHVYIDMSVEVPDADAFPIYAVAPRAFTVEEITRIADLMLGEGAWYQVDMDTGEPLDGNPREQVSDNPRGLNYYCRLRGERGAIRSLRTTVTGLDNWYLFNTLSFGASGDRTGRNVGTPEEAAALADALVSQLAPDMVLESIDADLEGLANRTIHADMSTDYGYRLYYARQVDGLLVTPVNKWGAEDAIVLYNPALHYETFQVDVGENGIFSWCWEYPLTVTGRIADDCELLTFAQIMDIVGTIAPLTIQSLEDNDNNALYIKRATLGYMCVQERGQPTHYQLIPVWDFFGARTLRDDYMEGHNSVLLTVNAIDGTIIDRDYGY